MRCFMKILVTGGAGFIASHTNVELLNAGYDVVVVDNLVNSSRESVARVEELTGKKISFYEEDLLNEKAIDAIFEKENIDSVIHFAALKAVGESCQIPLRYFDNNLTGTLNLLKVMEKHGVKSIVFSSSATVYGKPESVPIREDFPLSVSNPYGRTKLIIEDMLRDIYKSDNEWDIALLRYFNPIGAHESGMIGENPHGIPNNLLPYVAKVAAGQLECVNVFGDDYDTADGSCIRDYINVVDLAKAHVIAMDRMLENKSDEHIEIFNLGTGNGVSVLELINTFEQTTGVKVPHKIVGRREGDIEKVWANPEHANKVLGWTAKETLADTLQSAWNWQKRLRERGIQ